jgi:hypothetical protein
VTGAPPSQASTEKGDRMERTISPVRLTGLIMVLTLAAFGLMPMTPAAAAIAGLQRVESTSPVNSVFPKVASASCLPGKKVIGMGGYVTNGNGEVVLNEIIPDAALGRVRATAWEDETGYAGNWSITAIAMCADPLPGLQRVQEQTPADSSDKELYVSCPSGKNRLGLGAYIAGSEGQVFLDALDPLPSNTNGGAHASEDQTGTTGNWSITLVAICANSFPGLSSATNWSGGGSTSPKSVDAVCPAGKVAITAGGVVTAGIGAWGRNEVMIDSLDLPGSLDRGVARAVEDGSGASFDWHVISEPQCATP